MNDNFDNNYHALRQWQTCQLNPSVSLITYSKTFWGQGSNLDAPQQTNA